ncbi:MAG: SIS domain-containing protein [Anaerolineae bacterium]|nr:SIS domain-containing protein [Anaerolineae bacterium]
MLLQQEINEQSAVLARLLKEQADNVTEIAAAIREFDPAYVLIAARGTSDNAARYAQYVLGSTVRLPVALSTPSLHTLYAAPPNLSKGLVIGISQSGQAEDVRRVLADAREQGALTLAITNFPDSPMGQTAAHHIELCAGVERSVAATKTYTAQLTVVAMLGAELANDDVLKAELAAVPVLMQATINGTGGISDWVERYRYIEQFAAIGRGFNYPTAFEISLKVKELTYIIGEGYSEADFRHGPIATIMEGFPVIAVAPQGKTLPQMHDLLDKLHEKGAALLVISNDGQALNKATKQMPIPAAPEWLSPIISVVPGQVFAMHLASVRGYPVDQPRGLTKVTVTE